jgi:predicted GIY-YIG superfamily endonuclease
MPDTRPFFCQNLVAAGDDGYFPEFVYPDEPRRWREVTVPSHWFTYVAYAHPGCRTPIYIGYTNNIHRRLSQHRAKKAWWPLVDRIIVDCYDSQREAVEVETHLINHFRPLLNVAGNCHA